MKYSITCLTKPQPSHSAIAPKWFLDHYDFRDVKQIEKKFDTLGLKNFTTTAKIDSSKKSFNELRRLFDRLEEDGDFVYDDTHQMLASASIMHILAETVGNCDEKSLAITKNILDDRNRILFKSGTEIKKIYANVMERFENVSKHSKSNYSDRFNRVNKLLRNNRSKSYKIVFSTKPWDILTMSMRGIDSCQRWNASHAKCLIGSVLCPYVGIIYATNGVKTKFGERMISRSVVRLVRSGSGPFQLYVEGAYLNEDEYDLDDEDYDDDDYNESETAMFRNALANKIKDNKSIARVTDDTYNKYVPMSDVIRNINPENRTYFDSGLRYR